MADTKVQVTEDLAAIKYFAQNNDRMLLNQLIFALPFANDPTIRKIMQLRSPMNLPKYSAADGWRPLDENIENPLGDQGAFSKRVITPRTAMKILKIRPQQFKQTFFADQVAPNAKEIPGGFAGYFWLAQTQQGATEITKNSFLGVDPDSIAAFSAVSTYDAGDRVTFVKDAAVGEQYWECIAGSTTTAGDSPSTEPSKWKSIDNQCMAKGLGTIIKEEYAGLDATQKIATGALTSSNAYESIKTMYRSIDDSLKDGDKFYAYCSISSGEKFLDDVDNKYYKGVVTEEATKLVVRGTNGNCIVKPVAWMGSHPGVIMTKANNLTFGTDIMPNFTSIGKMVEDLHGYKTIQKATLAFQIADTEILYLNDQGWS